MEDLRSYNIRQAIDYGKRALQNVKDMEKILADARWWCYADLLSVSVLMTYYKRKILLNANSELDRLNHNLELFQQELDSLSDYELPIEDLESRFRMYHYFGWIFTDMVTEKQISDLLSTLAESKAQIRGILRELDEALETETAAKIEELHYDPEAVTL